MTALTLQLNNHRPLSLDTDQGWVCESDPELAELLNGLFPVIPSHLPYGSEAVTEAQAFFQSAGGRLEILESFELPEENYLEAEVVF